MPLPSSSLSVASVIVYGKYTAGGSTPGVTRNTLHFRRTSATNPLVKSDLYNKFKTAVLNLWPQCVAGAWNSTSVGIRWIEDAQDREEFTAVSLTPINRGTRLTSFCAVCITLQPVIRGQGRTGCLLLGPIAGSFTTKPNDDLVNAAHFLAYGQMATALTLGFTDANGNVWKTVILSRPESQTKTNPTTVIYYDVAKALLNKRITVMRRRQRRTKY